VAVLGDAAAGDLHVRFDSVGAVSLYGRYFRGRGYGDVGVRGWRVVDGEAGRGESHSGRGQSRTAMS
jgi:hypothetical protein